LKKLCLTLFAVALLAAPASAAPNWLGQNGLLLTPTADALNARNWNATFHFISDVANIGAANLGLARGLEAGVVWFDPERGDSKFTGAAKYQLLPETPTGIGLAAGWWDIFDEIDSTPYAVASKRVTMVSGFPLRLHLGVGGGIYDNVFAGADLPLATNLLAMAEYDGEDLNAGVRWAIAGGFRIDAGLVSEEFGAGISYNASF